MKHFGLSILALLILSCNSGQLQENYGRALKQIERLEKSNELLKSKNNNLIKLIDSLENQLATYKVEEAFSRAFDIKDSITILAYQFYKNSNNFERLTFINHGYKTKYHEQLKQGYDFYDIYDKEQYFNIYRKTNQKITIDSLIKAMFIGNWTPIYKYNNAFYNYHSSCDFRNKGFTLTDSALIKYYMDGLAPQHLSKITLNDKTLSISTSHSSYTLDLLDSINQIYLFKEGGRSEYVTPTDQINNFPIIIEDCFGEGLGNSIKFDP